jgi:hypothetical protein
MRLVAALVGVVVCLVAAESAEALSCAPAPPAFKRFQAADVAVVAQRVSAEIVGPALPPPTPGVPYVGGWGATGPVVLFRYRVLRVYKANVNGPRPGDLFIRLGRVQANTWRPALGWVGTFLVDRENGSLSGTFASGGCRRPDLTRTEMRNAALLERYNTGRGAAASACSWPGDSCWSIKRDGREAVLRLGTFAPDGDFTPLRLWEFGGRYDLCVRGPHGRRKCKRFPLKREPSGLLSSRVRWSRHFPDAGQGVYRVQWLPPGFEKAGYKPRVYRKYLTTLTFRR